MLNSPGMTNKKHTQQSKDKMGVSRVEVWKDPEKREAMMKNRDYAKNGKLISAALKGKTRIPRETRYCACGCGATFSVKTTSPRKFMVGHNGRGKKMVNRDEVARVEKQKQWYQTPEGIAEKERRVTRMEAWYSSPEGMADREKKSTMMKAGKATEMSELAREAVEKCGKDEISRRQKEWWESEEGKAHRSEMSLAKIGQPSCFKGHHHTEENKRILAISSHFAGLGRVPWNIGLTKETDQRIGNHSMVMKELWQNSDFVQKQMKARMATPNKLEHSIGVVADYCFPNRFECVSDGKVIIGGRCPDFIDEENHLIIEGFGDYWHGLEVTGMTNEEAVIERTEHFAKYGYKTLVIWENEMKNINNVRTKILAFCNGGV